MFQYTKIDFETSRKKLKTSIYKRFLNLTDKLTRFRGYFKNICNMNACYKLRDGTGFKILYELNKFSQNKRKVFYGPTVHFIKIYIFFVQNICWTILFILY